MRITETIFWAHLQCQTKSYLKASGAVGEQRAFTEWEGKLVEDFQRPFCLQLRLNYADDAYMVGCSLSQALDKQCSLVFDCTVQTPELQSSIPLLERVPSSATAPHNLYIPVRFLPREKLTPHDKLLLAFDALVLSVATSQAPPFGKIIHGSAYAVAKIPLDTWMASAQAVVGTITTQQAHSTPPPLVLNKHCTACEFQGRCRQTARETDDLSLLASMTDKRSKSSTAKGFSPSPNSRIPSVRAENRSDLSRRRLRIRMPSKPWRSERGRFISPASQTCPSRGRPCTWMLKASRIEIFIT